MDKITWKDRIRYAFDNTLSKGSGALVAWLALASALVVLAIALVVQIARAAPDLSFPESFWDILMQALAPNPVPRELGPWPYLLAMLVDTIAGIFLISIFISLLTTAIQNRLDTLREGRSRVLETGHTVILGWSEQIFTLVSELVTANASRPRSCVVVLADRDKVAMEEELRSRAGPWGRTRVVCRRGDPAEMSNLPLVSLNTAKSLIVLGDESDDPDATVIKIMLAVVNNPNRRAEPYHVVAEIRDPRNMQVARMVGGNEVELVLEGDFIARIIAQTCRQSGLSVVYTELLRFEGDGIYMKREPSLVGRTFGEALFAYTDSSVIGLVSSDGLPSLNPPMDRRIEAGDSIMAISRDEANVLLSGRTEYGIRQEAIRRGRPAAVEPEHTLILGWNWRAPTVVRQLDRYVAPGSAVTVVSTLRAEDALKAECQGPLANLTCSFRLGDTTDRRTLDALALDTYGHVIILCYSDDLSRQEADARTMITLLHLRDIGERTGSHSSIVSEMMDIRNRDLAEVTKADDFVVSDHLISLMLAQVSEDKVLNAVFAELFDPEGSEIYLKAAGDYIALGGPVNFYTVLEAARRRGETAIGYRLRRDAKDVARNYGVVVNPCKEVEVTFDQEDKVIVVAAD
jgi:ion channel POLLUX/CASTOR